MFEYQQAYGKLYDSVYGTDCAHSNVKLSNFVAMRGKLYDQHTTRLMVVGRATNGWGEALNVNVREEYVDQAASLFKQNDRVQPEWNMSGTYHSPYSVYDKIDADGAVTEKDAKYYLSKSSFWRVARATCYHLLPNAGKAPEEKETYWLDNIAWSNMYKIAPLKEGNPNERLIKAQQEACKDILKAEIQALVPTHIILMTDKTWFDQYAFGEIFDCKNIIEYDSEEIIQRVYLFDNRTVLLTKRPENYSLESFMSALKAVLIR